MFGSLVPTETLLGHWRLTTDLFGRVFCDDVGAEPGSVISELGGFAVKESKFRREMERLRNSQQRDLTLEVELRRVCFFNFDNYSTNCRQLIDQCQVFSYNIIYS